MANPEGFRIKESYRVRYEEVDTHGIVSHVQLAHYFTGARVAYFRALGIQPSEFQRMPIQPAVVHFEIDFRSPARFDDHLDVWTRVSEVGTKSFSFIYRVHNSANEAPVAEGKTVLATVDISTEQAVAVPDQLRRRIEKLEGR
jgi:acyl-CoA thioester hydrolase